MNSLTKLYLERAENELLLVETLFKRSNGNLFKSLFIYNIDMLPSDPSGSLDESFSLKGGTYG